MFASPKLQFESLFPSKSAKCPKLVMLCIVGFILKDVIYQRPDVPNILSRWRLAIALTLA
jgi:hypothetical protein